MAATTGLAAVVGTAFTCCTHDSARQLAPAITTGTAPDRVGAPTSRVDWAKGYFPIPPKLAKHTNGLGFGYLALNVVPVVTLSRGTQVVVGGHLEDLATGHVHAAWGLPAAADASSGPSPIDCVEVATFYTYPRSRVEYAEGPAALIPAALPAQVAVRVVFHYATINDAAHRNVWAIDALLHAGTVAWPAQPNSAVPVTGAREITVLPDVRTWSTPLADQVAMDFKMRGCAVAVLPSPQVIPDMPIRADFDVALHMRVHAVLAHCAGSQPAAIEMAANRSVINDQFTGPHIEPHWTAATHTFEANLAQFTPTNAVVNHGLRLHVTPSRHGGKPYTAAELRTTNTIAPPTPIVPSTLTALDIGARMRGARASGLVSAVFLYRDPPHIQEADIVETLGSRPGQVQLNLFHTRKAVGDRKNHKDPYVGPREPPSYPIWKHMRFDPTLHHDYAVHWAAWTHEACPAGQTCGRAMSGCIDGPPGSRRVDGPFCGPRWTSRRGQGWARAG
ncbi:hypothetical protein AMAG_14033 [Allomyces macrogynus ATCC 38327]|uniref:GH16 domain-containing protein n=1 Tax=Allomyces macrogynus (strain ATCC 38327) TaxID=578462 RepID=A0A0L0T428_ALLM3|nr:hypothetical protein AMAG_14033 [Allomyces macrogynus ATCC 38327]|eukprot:KNE69461.1 hypothetical protein AMAG_14033 [Allomyces macrogynus ATCC 38327]